MPNTKRKSTEDTTLLEYLKRHRQELNLAQISRKAGRDDSYLKHVVADRLVMSAESEKWIALVLTGMGIEVGR